MALDKASGQLFVVGANGEVAVIATASNAVEKTYAVKGVSSAIAIAYDAGSQRIFVGAQGSDNVVVADAGTGQVIQDVKVGAGTLGLVFEPTRKLVYAANRGAGTLTVLDVDGRIVANLEGGPLPNHVSVAPKGVVYALNKGKAEDPAGNNVRRIQLK
jgi:YVTN family beta-propeller protein